MDEKTFFDGKWKAIEKIGEGSFGKVFLVKHNKTNEKYAIKRISKLDKNAMILGMYIIIDMFWDRIKQNKGEKKIIYIDVITFNMFSMLLLI